MDTWASRELWAMFQTPTTLVKPLPSSLGGRRRMLWRARVAWPSLLIGICTCRKVPGQNLWHSGAPLCPIWHQHELHQTCLESRAGGFKSYKVGWVRTEMFYLCICEKVSCWCNGSHCCFLTFPMSFTLTPWLISAGDKPERTVLYPWLLDPKTRKIILDRKMLCGNTKRYRKNEIGFRVLSIESCLTSDLYQILSLARLFLYIFHDSNYFTPSSLLCFLNAKWL